MSKELYYVTGNDGKFKEVKDFLERYNPEITLKQYHVDLVEHQTFDQRAIALSKAKQGWDLLQKPLLVDDAGIYFEKYNNFPGVFTKFIYHGIGFEGLLKLTEEDSRAYFLLYLVYIDGPKSYEVFEGKCQGKITWEQNGATAHPKLPYDEIFLPDGSAKTYAQLRGSQEMDEYAYRLKALRKFLKWFKDER